MAGAVLYKKGRHWSRSHRTTVSAATNKNLVRELVRSTRCQISENHLVKLLRAVAAAHHFHSLSTKLTFPTRADAKRQLEAMLKLDDFQLSKALQDCDIVTRREVSKAENALSEIKWVDAPSEIDTLTIQIPAPESIRESVRLALSAVREETTTRGPKEKPYQLDLARDCLEVWHVYHPPKTPGRLDFCRFAFDAAGIHVGDKRLEALLSKAGKGRIK